MERRIEEQLVQELEKAKNEKDNDDLIDKDLTNNEIKANFTFNTINESINIPDTTSEHFSLDENTIKTTKSKKYKKYKLYNTLIGEYEYKDKNENLSLNKYTNISRWFKDVDISEVEKLITYDNKYDVFEKENFYPIFYKYLDSYKDIQVNWNNLEIRTKLMKIYLFHILNHILKRKEEIELNDNIDKIINNTAITDNQKLNKELFRSHESEFISEYYNKHVNPKTKLDDSYTNKDFITYHKEIKEKYEDINDKDEINIKDQGFTCPKVLILVPYKKHARIILEEMINIFSNNNWKGITNKKKFKDEYSEFDSNDDCFRMGINISFFENKMKLYSPFDESDIILASPLGLKLATPTDNDKTFKNNKVYDFLSSIEIFLMDFSEVFIYQNIEHLNEILSFINKQPKNNQNIVDINRIKGNYANNFGEFLRQNIIVSHFKSLDIDLSINDICKNINGKVLFDGPYENQPELIKKEFSETYNYMNSKNYEIRYEFKILRDLKGEDDFDEKFKYFTKNIWQNLYESFEKHTIIFISSTFDYLRLKSFFKQKSKSVCYISEDTDKKDWQRNRLYFENGKYKFLLYNERAHIYKKINLKFAKNIFFYSLPEDPKIFNDLIHLIDPVNYNKNLEKYNIESKQNEIQKFGSVIALVTPIEKYNLQKILGNESKKIIKNKLEYYSC